MALRMTVLVPSAPGRVLVRVLRCCALWKDFGSAVASGDRMSVCLRLYDKRMRFSRGALWA